MRFNTGPIALAATAALALLSGCSGSSPSAGLTPTVAAAMTNGSSTVRSDTSGELAYAVDPSGNVDVYSYPGFVLQQTLTGFSGPQAECVDSSGNVWVADTGNSRLVEYAHGGSQPIATLSDPGSNPISCAVSPVDGSVAATVTGGIAIYTRGRGKPHTIAGGKPLFLAYDAKGNLFGDGLSAGYKFLLEELPNGSKSLQTVSVIGGTIGFPGALQYVKNVLNIGDQDGAVTYQTHVKKSAATVTGSTPLNGSSDCVSSFIYKNRLLCPDAGNLNLEVYAYPKGGAAIQTLPGIDGAIVISADSK
jgi:NHL repeat